MRKELPQLGADDELEDLEIARLRDEDTRRKSERTVSNHPSLPLGTMTRPYAITLDVVAAKHDDTTGNEHGRKQYHGRFTIDPARVHCEIIDNFPARSQRPHFDHELSAISFASNTSFERVPARQQRIEHQRHLAVCRRCATEVLNVRPHSARALAGGT